MSAPGRLTRCAARLAALAVAAGAATALQLAGAPAASAVFGLDKYTSISATNSAAVKVTTAFCPTGQRVVGGGGWVHETGAQTHRIALAQLQPAKATPGGRDSYTVTGAETGGGITGDWWVQAYALCVPDPNGTLGVEIVTAASAYSSAAVKTAAAVCPGAKRVLGTGARASVIDGQVVLQVSRASGPGDIARAQAQEDADGYTGTWGVLSYAVCANPPAGYQVVTGRSSASSSEAQKTADAVCPTGKFVHGAGAAITSSAPPGVSLQVVYPSDDLTRVSALAGENTPTAQSWDFIVAQAICAYY